MQIPTTPTRKFVVLPLPVWLVVVAWNLAVRVFALLMRRWPRQTPAETTPALPTATTHQRDPDCAQMAWLLYAKLNHYRLSRGLPQCVWHEKLEQSSLYHNCRMLALGEFAHVLTDGVGPADRITRFEYPYERCAENLAYYEDPRLSLTQLAEAIHQGWIDSPGHHENLIGDYREIGIGVTRVGQRYYATQNFATPERVRDW